MSLGFAVLGGVAALYAFANLMTALYLLASAGKRSPYLIDRAVRTRMAGGDLAKGCWGLGAMVVAFGFAWRLR